MLHTQNTIELLLDNSLLLETEPNIHNVNFYFDKVNISASYTAISITILKEL